MLTFQDWQQSADKESFIMQAISEFKSSSFYNNAIVSQRYFQGDNDILSRMKWFYNSSGNKQEDTFKTNNKIANEFYKKIVMQENSYLLGNGVTVSDDIKSALGPKFDALLQKCGVYALVDGTSWGYCYVDKTGKFKMNIFKGTEIVPLYDEMTNEVRCAIRFWQIDNDKPMYIELYEEDGKTDYKQVNNKLEIVNPKRAYIIKKKVDQLEVRESVGQNWSTLPLIPLYSDTKKPVLNEALKSKIDLYDIIMSDFGNNLEDAQDVYWVLKNYNGQDMGEFLADYKYYKSIKVDDDGDASPHTLEVPYQARKEALEILRRQIYQDSMSLDISVLSGGSLTNVAIKANMMDLDLKTDSFEWEVIDFMDSIVYLLVEYSPSLKVDDYSIQFIRRSIVNDSEVIDNIVKIRGDISNRTALKLNPLIEDVDAELEEIDKEGISKISLDVTEQQ